MADPVFFFEPAHDEDASDYEYESDHYYDGDDDDNIALTKKRHPNLHGTAITKTLSAGNHAQSKSLSSIPQLPIIKQSTAPVLYAHVDPGLTATPQPRYFYEPGKGEVVAFLKNWRELFDQARPTRANSTKRKEKLTTSRTASERALRAATTGFLGFNTGITVDDESSGTPSREQIAAAAAEHGFQPSLEKLGPLEIRPTSPPSQSLAHVPLPPTSLEPAPEQPTHDEGLPTQTSPSPPTSPNTAKVRGINTSPSAKNVDTENQEVRVRSRKRRADELDAGDGQNNSKQEERPARRQKSSRRTSVNKEHSTPVRRSTRNKNKK